MVFAARQLQEKCQEQNVDLYSTYVDLTKAFDNVSREGLWRIIAKYGCPPKFITIVRHLYDGMMATVQDDGNSSEPFLVSNGVKQGCVLSPTLFSLMFSAMLTDAFADTDIGIGIRHRMDGSVFNLRRLKAKTKVKTDTINDFLFADDCALNSISVDDMQQNVDKYAEACTNFGLTYTICPFYGLVYHTKYTKHRTIYPVLTTACGSSKALILTVTVFKKYLNSV